MTQDEQLEFLRTLAASFTKSLAARVKVENELWQVAVGARDLPDKEQCRDWARRLGIPEETLALFDGVDRRPV